MVNLPSPREMKPAKKIRKDNPFMILTTYDDIDI